MPTVPSPPDYYVVIALTEEQDVNLLSALFVVAATSEEEAVAKTADFIAAREGDDKLPPATLFTAMVTPTFPPPTP